MELSNYFFVLIPTSSGKAPIMTNFKIGLIPQLLNKMVIPIAEEIKEPNKWIFPSVAMNAGIPAARTALVDKLRITLDNQKIKHNGVVRALFWDDDIWIEDKYDIVKFVEAIKKADENGWNLIGNYHVPYNESRQLTDVLIHKTDFGGHRFYTEDEIKALKNLDPLPDTVGGLGFYYGDVPLDYKFRYDRLPEDVNFFEDNKIELRYVDVPLLHEKRFLV